MITRLPRWLDAVFVGVLAVYALAGIGIATFHGDEAMQIYTSHDYVIAFIERDPLRLQTTPPYPIDSDGHLRILNGTVNRHLIGVSWQIAGLHSGMLPPRPGWDWGLGYDDNVATNHRPTPALLNASRVSSALFFAASIGVVFVLGNLLGGRWVAWLAAGLYALNPVLLLNSRRAMQEGSLLFFGLLAVLTAAVIAQRRAHGQRVPAWVWIGFIAAGAVGLASKHNTAIFVAGALAWVGLAELIRVRRAGDLRRVLIVGVALVGCAALMLGGFVALSPALWNDPIPRLGDLLAVRAELLAIQVSGVATGAMPLDQRVTFMFFQPFAAPLMHYEVMAWNEVVSINAEAAAYAGSALAGLQAGVIGGILLTLIALVGVGGLVWRLVRGQHIPHQPADAGVLRAGAVGVLAWLVVTMAAMMTNPLPWQRYYLPLIPISAVCAALGAVVLVRLLNPAHWSAR